MEVVYLSLGDRDIVSYALGQCFIKQYKTQNQPFADVLQNR